MEWSATPYLYDQNGIGYLRSRTTSATVMAEGQNDLCTEGIYPLTSASATYRYDQDENAPPDNLCNLSL